MPEEFEEAIRMLKEHNGAGESGIWPELLKWGDLMRHLQKVFNNSTPLEI